MLLRELNGLNVMIGDITSAYLMAKTNELIFFKAGPEFGAKAGHLMVVSKALYGLWSSGKLLHDLLFDTIKGLGFTPSKADPDIWLKDNGQCYEYVCCYVDDLIAIMKDPKAFINELEKIGFGLNGVTDTPEVFLGGCMGRDSDGTLHWGAKRYISRSMEAYKQIMGSKPVTCTIPLLDKSQPKMDSTVEHDRKGRAKYQSLIGILQWIVTLGRLDIACAVMNMSRFRTAPREGHLLLLGNVFGYLQKHPDGALRFKMGTPEYERRFTTKENDWERTVYHWRISWKICQNPKENQYDNLLCLTLICNMTL
jgi:Reverse transcriptase (RNA-dependent DNA polymerase)